LTIKELRKNKNVNQSVIATLLGVTLRTVQNIEAGNTPLKTEYAKKLANYFNVSVDYLLGLKESPHMPTLNKKGVEVSIDEILHFIIENEATILENHNLFKVWLSEKVYKGMAKLSTDLRSE